MYVNVYIYYARRPYITKRKKQKKNKIHLYTLRINVKHSIKVLLYICNMVEKKIVRYVNLRKLYRKENKSERKKERKEDYYFRDIVRCIPNHF